MKIRHFTNRKGDIFVVREDEYEDGVMLDKYVSPPARNAIEKYLADCDGEFDSSNEVPGGDRYWIIDRESAEWLREAVAEVLS